VNFPEFFQPKWVLNCNEPSIKETVPVAREGATVTVRTEYNSQMRALYDALNISSLPIYFGRLEGIGALITGSTYHKSRLDMALKLEAANEVGDQDGVYGFEFRFRIVHDNTWGRAYRWQVTNTLPSLF
ncbi:MAG TPA: hypothetical protein VEF04_12240, partial [Blastocatellia bacterium]|nr:hypothetical protein [Blastocatellia bacterium]